MGLLCTACLSMNLGWVYVCTCPYSVRRHIHVEVYQGGIDSMQEAIRPNKNPSSSYRGLTWSRGNSRGISLRIWSLLTTTPKLPSSNVSNHATAESLDLKPSYFVKFNYLGILSRVVHVSSKKRHRFEIPREEF